MRNRFISLTLLMFFLLQNVTVAFAASPRTNYLLYCSGCHRPMGEGKPPNVPTLHNELGHMMRVDAMRGYLARVPGSAQLPKGRGSTAGGGVASSADAIVHVASSACSSRIDEIVEFCRS